MKTLFLFAFPPPYAGPEISAEKIREQYIDRNDCDKLFLDVTLKKKNSDKGKFNITGLMRFFLVYLRFIFMLFRVKKVWLNLSSSKIGFIRDSIYIISASLMKKHIYSHYRGNNFKAFYSRESLKFQFFIKYILNKIDFIITANDDMKDNFNFLPQKHNYKTLINGFTIKDFEKRTIVDKHNITIFFMGHLIYSKGFYHLVMAYKHVYKKYGNRVNFMFAGERVNPKPQLSDFLSGFHKEHYQSNQQEIHEYIDEFINNAEMYNAKYLGLLNYKDKITTYNNSDIYVFPSFTESFGNTIVEAMLMHLPVIATNQGVFSEIAKNTNAGFSVEFGDIDALMKNIEILIENSELRTSMGICGHSYCQNKFTIENVCNQIDEILKCQIEKK